MRANRHRVGVGPTLRSHLMVDVVGPRRYFLNPLKIADGIPSSSVWGPRVEYPQSGALARLIVVAADAHDGYHVTRTSRPVHIVLRIPQHVEDQRTRRQHRLEGYRHPPRRWHHNHEVGSRKARAEPVTGSLLSEKLARLPSARTKIRRSARNNRRQCGTCDHGGRGCATGGIGGLRQEWN
jgi:hypothetical protein